jgi:hypothetical protein
LEDGMKRSEAAAKTADLSSGIGAGILGLGLGVLLAEDLQPIAGIVLVLGAVLHGWGMWSKHHLERADAVELPHWRIVLYWICWLGLAAIAVLIVTRAAKQF